MRRSYKSQSCCVVDNGLFVEFATVLADHFGKVFYYSPWESQFPKSNSVLIGSGIPGVTRTDDLFGIIPEVDLWCFPDIYHGPLQVHLAEMLGKRVWGSRMGEELELYRRESKRHMSSLKIPIGPFVTVTGLDALRNYLQSHDNQWVKISRTRGDMESFHADNYTLVEPRLDELEHTLGAKKHIMEFIVEDGIDDAVEVAFDGFSVDGKFPSRALVGVELKDKGYIGIFQDVQQMPKAVREANEKLSPTLKQYRYRNFLSLEMRITRDGVGYVIDPCMRAGSPPSEVAQMIYANLPDILWYGAEGECVEPEPAGTWGVELLIHSGWADKNWQAVQFPKKLRPHVKLRNLAIIKGEYYVVPQSVGLPEIGAVVAMGDTLEKAIATCKDIAKQVDGYYIDVFPDSLDDAQKEIETLKDFGIEL